MSTNEVDAPAAPSRRGARRIHGIRGIHGFADRWPFRLKLNVLLGVPLAVVAVLLGYIIVDLSQESDRAQSAAQLVRDSTEVAKLVDRLESEHQQAILLSVRHEATNDGGTPSQSAYRVAQVMVDSQVRTVRETFGDRLPDTEAQALREITGLDSLRDTIEQGYLPADNIDPAYTNAAQSVIDGLGLDRNAALAATFTGNLLDSLLRADAAHAAYETGVFSARTGDSNALIEFTGAVGNYAVYTYQAERFSRFATDQQADTLGGIEHSVPQATIGRHYAELTVDPSSLQADTPAEARRAFQESLASYGVYRDQAESRLKITTSLIDEIADRADDASESAQSRARLLLWLTIVGFALWIAFSVLVRRSVVRPVLALTGAARQVADVADRELARVADDDAEDDGPPRLREIPVTARDEIGQLAEVFNRVQTTAVALLARQVLSRRNTAEMFGNVGRRVSNLTTRQLALIDAVERGETDPALLERLYSIDHIAVRLRRNADSLMLLAGIRETVLDSGPTALTNVVRAALGQIEGYQRVRLSARTEVMVEPDIIGDLTLMVAELLENAVSFSPADSTVEVSVRDVDEGALITVTDHGLGMSAERLEEENARLIRRERLDLVPTKVLGLFVVGALARRWEVGVSLARTRGGGVTAEVTIPSTLLLTMSAVASGGSAGAPVSDGADRGQGARGTAGAELAVGAGSAAGAGSVVGTGDTAGAGSAAGAPGSAGVGSTAGDRRSGYAGLGHAARGAEGVGRDAGTVAAQAPLPGVPAQTGRAGSDEQSGALPRRVPRRDDATGGPRAPLSPAADAGQTPSVPQPPDKGTPRATPSWARNTPSTPPAPAGGDGGSRPLRRRVRGATLRTTIGAAADQAVRQAARPADADAVRLALEEFEEAVERANRDSCAPSEEHDTHHPHDQHTTDDRQPTVDRPTQGGQPPTPRDGHDHPGPREPHHQNHLPEGAEQ
ncbi:ATP-binding protein [Streptomyces sp. NPDC048751]|uniref:ATP-binding protein n=1 Tax=Streptomyces sp. NPDC048751 TaxID=3365591 RepID=UPI0037188049